MCQQQVFLFHEYLINNVNVILIYFIIMSRSSIFNGNNLFQIEENVHSGNGQNIICIGLYSACRDVFTICGIVN